MKRQRLLETGRRLKHQAWLTRKALSGAGEWTTDRGLALWDRIHPYRFEPTRYPLSFLRLPAPALSAESGPVQKVIYTAWTGDNVMSPRREAGLTSIREQNPDVDVRLVTASNLTEHLVPEHPLHSTYELLSLNHRADYLRAYLLHYHGGGYADIKPCLAPWTTAFEWMAEHPDTWMIGYPEVGHRHAAWIDDRLGRDVRVHYSSLVGMASLVVRPRTPLTQFWLDEAERRLSYYADLLREHPGNTWGSNVGYPIPWTGLMSQIVQPLQLRFLQHVRQEPLLKPALEGHR